MNKQTPAISPLLLTHWDPDLYPEGGLSPIEELVIHLLAHGQVWLKEVDLFLNERIRRYLSNERNLRIFESLVNTGRIKLLVPDKTFSLPLNPLDQPLLATAMARDGKVPLKSEPWVLTDETKHFCSTIDAIFVNAQRRVGKSREDALCRHRQTPPSGENQFATKLRAVLSQTNKEWLERTPFKGITGAMIDRFPVYTEDHETALADLVKADKKPNATNGFYRSLAYQCADLFDSEGESAVQAMKNLAQSVYAYCELKREDTVGTYAGERLAELPPDRPTEQTRSQILRMEVVPKPITIPLTDNIGTIISSVLDKCDMNAFWSLAGRSSTPEQDFRSAWGHMAKTFADEYKMLGSRSSHSPQVEAGQLILAASILAFETANLAVGFSWTPQVAAGVIGVGAIATLGPPMVDLIRRAQLDIEKQDIADRVKAAAAIRCSKIV